MRSRQLDYHRGLEDAYGSAFEDEYGTCGKGGHVGGDFPEGEKENEGSVPEELCVVEPVVVAGPEVVVESEVLVESEVAELEELAESEVAEPEEPAESEVVAVAIPCLNASASGPLSPGTQDNCIVPIGKKPQASMACQLNVHSRKPSVKAVQRTKPGDEVRALRTMVVPPRPGKLLQCRVSDVFDGCLGLVEPGRQCTVKARVRVGRTLVEAGADKALVGSANFSEVAQAICRGQIEGLCQEVDQRQGQLRHYRKVVEGGGSLPVQFQERFARSRRCLDGTRALRRKQLLAKCAGRLDVGRTDLLERYIDPGGHRSMKQRARRMVPVRRREMKGIRAVPGRRQLLCRMETVQRDVM
ncbi:Hypothetical predicted protein [Octopus vulgaris]|uniref:Uncharacterized protein n=1 Tax=Octopus vulgaris TaxID=6645 RepID=A0AA36AL64_OCTVU|nr:Hypothetical predicted protein [Octopus vulgaris]